MSSVLDEDTTLWYACKANPMSAILKVFRNLGFGIDVASTGELDQALRSGIRPENIISTGPAKSKAYLETFLENNVETIVCESINQLKTLNEVSKENKIKSKALLRVQIDWGEGESVLGGSQITPFGIGIDDWKKIQIKDFPNVDVVGLHAFQWGNLTSIDEIESIWDKTCDRLIQFSKEMNIDLKILDLGGGIGLSYQNDVPSLQFNFVNEVIEKLKKKYQLQKIWLELGRYAVGECGHYLAQVVDVKEVRGKNIIVLNGGINHIARPALTEQPFPCTLLRETNIDKKHYQIHGPLCTALDKLSEVELPGDISPGDWIAFHQAGAYGFTEAMPFFLCHDLPAESIYYNGNFMTPRISKTSADWMI